jgi:phenylalanyl-tRNA synthetase beta chain
MEGNVRLFEVGAVFAPTGNALPREALHVGALIMGQRRPPHFTEPDPPAFDVWDARALGERMGREVYGDGIALVPGEGEWLWLITHEGNEVGRVFGVTLDRPVWAAQPFAIELWLGAVDSANVASPGSHAPATSSEAAPPRRHVQYAPLPVFPAAEFDVGLLVPVDLPVSDVERTIRGAAGALLERFQVFDEYRGEGVPGGFRSVGIRLTFRDATRTLRDKEVEGRRSKILQTLEKDLGIRPRSA